MQGSYEEMRERRLAKEEQKLREAGIPYTRQPDKHTCTVHFSGPENTPYAESRYTLEIVPVRGWPFKAPEAFFVGPAPQHPFYAFDADDEHRRTRTTNLANTDFGIYHERWNPRFCFVDFVERVRHSMTPPGEDEMRPFMCAQTK
ncbi:ubiquitin-conjugating enzyme E2 motif-containing protein [Pandoravirus inopinatum]|uniref:Ubiquitin-conjugating enzyme E2 motif-containing protein n=1 Tax=Pandoravirus inopinatum TaxID=1605721 RepID=A0A0B5J8N0_9VIRU|nr:ubiquitin-conjugating enzyme E2 motif-containing protein [Pandoravirus inopinatum]AJF97141.1 ubiquitin-conjugating enzyme E2 motif-containing protein [Pandoravirus inopinatum]